jgi:hypothetical protein
MVVTTVKKLFDFINMKVNHRGHGSLPLVPIPNQMNPLHILLSYSLQRNFNTVVPSAPRNPLMSENKLCIACLLNVTFGSSMELPFSTDCAFPNFFHPKASVLTLQYPCGQTCRRSAERYETIVTWLLELMTVRGAAVLTVEVPGEAEWIFCVRSREVPDVPKSFSLLYSKILFFSRRPTHLRRIHVVCVLFFAHCHSWGLSLVLMICSRVI